jgi:hypothetical protein
MFHRGVVVRTVGKLSTLLPWNRTLRHHQIIIIPWFRTFHLLTRMRWKYYSKYNLQTIVRAVSYRLRLRTGQIAVYMMLEALYEVTHTQLLDTDNVPQISSDCTGDMQCYVHQACDLSETSDRVPYFASSSQYQILTMTRCWLAFLSNNRELSYSSSG